MYFNRPVIYLNDKKDGQPVIGFVISGKDEKSLRVRVRDYVTEEYVEIHEQFLILYTEQRFEALFGMERELLMSLYWAPHREVIEKNYTPWSKEFVLSSLTINGFFEKYQEYLSKKN